MSFGFGKVAPGDWEKVKQGSFGDTVEAGDYFARLVGLKDFEPAKSKHKMGTLQLTFELTDANESAWRGKKVIGRFNYYTEEVEGKNCAKVNEISVQNLAQLIEAANASPELDGNGQFDVKLTVEKLAKVEPTVLIAVTHSSQGGKSYQDVGSFRAVTK
jgi:hypothetical protein